MTLRKRLDEALARYERNEAQDHFDPALQASRLLPHLVQIWHAEEALHVAEDGHAGLLPYPPRRYKADTPGYVAELDD